MLNFIRRNLRKRNSGEKKQKQITKLQRLKGEIKKNKLVTATQIKMLKSFEVSHVEICNFLKRHNIKIHPEVSFLMNLQKT